MKLCFGSIIDIFTMLKICFKKKRKKETKVEFFLFFIRYSSTHAYIVWGTFIVYAVSIYV